MKKRLYNIAQWTWGLPQTLLGAAVFLKYRRDRHFDYNGACATVWDKDSGVSLGKFILVPGKAAAHREALHKEMPENEKLYSVVPDRFMLEHEYGHSVQSLILGPAYLLLVGAPSFLWNRLPYFARMRDRTGKSYYSAVFEKTANHLGAKAGIKHDHAGQGKGSMRREAK